MTAFPYIMDEFSYFFETPFDVTDPAFPCNLDRPAGASPDGRMYIVNHFLDTAIGSIDVPDVLAINTTNAPTGNGSIGAQVDNCLALYASQPKAVLCDYVSMGDVFTAELTMNGLS